MQQSIPTFAGAPTRWRKGFLVAGVGLVGTLLAHSASSVQAGAAAPEVVDPNLAVRTVVSGLDQPTSMAFIGENDFLVLEKATGRVRRVTNGAVQGTVLDLPVNSGSERGLLGIALHPRFPQDPGVYLFWTESTTGADTEVLSETPLLGNRVDRFTWNGTALTMDRNIIRLRALQQDANQPERGNHNGGVLRFGPDCRLYIMVGDVGRRGQMQNLPDGPFGSGLPDDQFGGPEPDDAHLTGVILRLNDDGTAPRDNPFFRAGALRGGEVGENLQKVFAYGVRNSFGMAFEPRTGRLWDAQNGDDSFTEINRVPSGANLGWIQVMGPVSRVAQFRAIETDPTAPQPFTPAGYFGLQQVRWSPENIATNPQEALARMFHVFEDGTRFRATLTGRQEVPPVDTSGAAEADFRLQSDGTLRFRLRATRAIDDVTQAHIHLAGRGQNGVVVAFLFGFDPAGVDFDAGDVIAEGVLDDDDVIERPGFDGTVATLVQRMRDQRTYTNVHTLEFPAGEVRGQNLPTNARQVSRYVDPRFSWKFEIAPAALGFQRGRRLGRQYQGDMFVGAARTFLEGGQIFRFDLKRNQRDLRLRGPLRDRVADNESKYDITESERLLFGRNFGIGTDIQTGPNGNLFVVSLSNGAVYEIHRAD
ncbi:MAG: PQQ-dependent sugar dehydrogenase [Armatimonadota bacterium]